MKWLIFPFFVGRWCLLLPLDIVGKLLSFLSFLGTSLQRHSLELPLFTNKIVLVA